VTSSTPHKSGYIFAAIVVMVWSGFILVSRLGGVSPLTAWDTMALRFATASCILLPYWLWKRPCSLLDPRVLTLAVVGGIGYCAFVYLGFKSAPATHAALLLPGLLPFFNVIFACLIMGETFTRNRAVSLTVIAAGVGCLAVEAFSAPTGPNHSLWGDVLLLASSCCWALYGVLSRHWKIGPMASLTGVALITAALYLPVYLLFLPKQIAVAPTATIVTQIVYQGIIATTIAMWLYIRAQEILGPSTVGAFMAMIPAVAGLAAVPLLGEHLSVWLLAGLFFVSCGAFLGVKGLAWLKDKEA
jgi:drug/metabolite transporter (DMT)-like permease